MENLDKVTSDTARAAWLYFIEEFTQSQVAEKLGVSRSTVIRLLHKARESGLVTISLGVSKETFELERDLEKRFGLKTVRIVPEAEDGDTQRRWLGQVAAATLTELAQKNTIMAISWGRTLRSMADSLYGEVLVPGMKAVGLIGGLHNAECGTNPFEVAKIVGQYFGAPAHALYAPVYVRDAETAAGLISDTGVNVALNMARRAGLVVFSVGSLSERATMLQLGYINSTEKNFLEKKGAVGDIACRWIDAKGDPVELPPTIHPIGIALNELQQIPNRLLVAGGMSKTQAILASLRGGYATHLITDEAVATALLAETVQDA